MKKRKRNFTNYKRLCQFLVMKRKGLFMIRLVCRRCHLVGDVAQNLHNYFRALYKKVTEADIEEFESNYRGSDTEKTNLKDLYKKYKGNMKRRRMMIYLLQSQLLKVLKLGSILEEVMLKFLLVDSTSAEKGTGMWRPLFTELTTSNERRTTQLGLVILGKFCSNG